MYSKQKQRKIMIGKYSNVVCYRGVSEKLPMSDPSQVEAPVIRRTGEQEQEQEQEHSTGFFQRVKNWFTK